ncbi:trypsin-like serine protease [Streptomyces sp. NPDC005963]|uniref:trypsin-like serine protease n=1 Tax=Streptomyces sp. NPDC005963 TaxID=3156721 RepID=UPI0033C0C9D5
MRREIPAVATVLALAGTGLLATSAQAVDNTPSASQPAPRSAPQASEPSQSELRQRVAAALKAETDSKAPRTGKQSVPSARIIGGGTTTIASAPWMAQLYFQDSAGDNYFCGGVVVSPSKIVTAAHCVEGINYASTGAVVTGTNHVPTTTSSGALNLHGGKVSGVYRQWHHEKYDGRTLNNDVAVLTLITPTKAKPLPLIRSTDTALYNAGTDGKVYGWGRTSSTNPNSMSDVLKRADADIVSDTSCRTAYGTGFIAGTMLCAGKPPTGSDSTSETTCNGDSGGPLVAGGRLVGIVSWGDINCSKRGKYGVYAKVSAFQGVLRNRINDSNWSGDDHRADLFGRSGKTLYAWESRGSSITRRFNYGDFSGVNLLVQADLNRDDRQDLIYRTPNGDVFWAYSNTLADRKIGSGSTWKAYKQILAPNDLSGDDLPDLLAIDSAGKAYLYLGNGGGSFGARTLVGSGWSQFSMLRGHGDFNGDGRADVVGRAAGGKIYLYKGTGKASAPLSGRTLLTTNSSLNAIAVTGDVNGDGHADMWARDTAGKLWLYPGSGKSVGAFATRKQFGTGWSSYNLFG